MRHLTINCLFLVMLPSLLGAAVQGDPEAPILARDVRFDQHLNAPLPLQLVFRDEANQAIPLSHYFHNQPVVIGLVYYRCANLCDVTMNNLVKSLNAVHLRAGSDYQVLLISFDPTELPELAGTKKRNYASLLRDKQAFNAGWHFLTGSQSAIQSLTQDVGFHFRWDNRTQQFVHATGIMVATPEGRLSKYLYGVDYPPSLVRLALVDASEHRIGNPVDQFLLFCFHYDPAQGRYSLTIINTLKVAGMVTALLLGGIIGLFLYRDSRKRKAEALHVS